MELRIEDPSELRRKLEDCLKEIRVISFTTLVPKVQRDLGKQCKNLEETINTHFRVSHLIPEVSNEEM